MKANQGVERVYELLEQFEFDELSEQDKMYVLSMMTEKEYINMRVTLMDTENFLTNAEELTLSDALHKSLINKTKDRNILVKLLKKPIQIYKVAASVLVILGIYTVIQFSTIHSKNRTLALNDTIYIQKTDTVYEKLVDTVKIIKEKIIYVSQEKDRLKPVKLISTSNNVYDSSKEICPEDVDKIKALAFNSNISRDTLFRD
jgi:hypothetical protein